MIPLVQVEKERNAARKPHPEGAIRGLLLVEPAAVLEAWPIACLSECGNVIYITSAGEQALHAVSDPQGRRPIRKLDRNLLLRLSKALSANSESGYTTLFRRDGVLSHYTVLVRRMVENSQPAVSILFLDAGQETSELVDTHWSEVFR